MAESRAAAHRTILVVDVEGFGNQCRTDIHREVVRDGLYRVLQEAFYRTNIHWAGCDHEDRGDGLFVLIPPDVPKSLLVERLPYEIITGLRQHNSMHCQEAQIRLRMALHAGEIRRDAHGVVSMALILAFRLLDAEALRSALATSPGVLAMITSCWFFDEVVRPAAASNADSYRQVRVTVKETNTVAWIRLPDCPCSLCTGRETDQLVKKSNSPDLAPATKASHSWRV